MARVIVKFINGEERAGEVLSLNINSPSFYLQSDAGAGKAENRKILMSTVKEILFPKHEGTEGTRVRTETIEQSVFAGACAYKLVVEFRDGDVLNGTTLKYSPKDRGFFLLPINPGDKCERIYVNAGAVKNVDCRKLLGKILTDQKKISESQLDSALAYQREQREKKIGDILRDAAVITEAQLAESLLKQKEKSKLLGEILLEAGYITPDQLEDALSVQTDNRKKRLGQILVDLKYVTANDICIALATQFSMPWIDLSNGKIPSDVVERLPVALERNLGVLPVEIRDDKILVVATSQPQDPEIAAEVAKFTTLQPEFVIAFEGYIQKALDFCFPISNN